MQTGRNSKIVAREAPPASLPLGVDFELPPLRTRVERSLIAGPAVDAFLRIEFDGHEETFSANYKARWDRRSFEAALTASARSANAPSSGKLRPLVILPYLSEEHLTELARRSVSGLDLCGNGVISVPGRWFVQRSGQPNRFRIEQELRNPYKASASLVARTLLRQPAFRKLDDLHAEITRRGGQMSLALVSRAIKRLEEEVIVQSAPGTRVRLVQPDRLLDRLAAQPEPGRSSHIWRGRIALPTAEFLPRLFSAAAIYGVRVAMTGIGSAAHHAALNMEDVAHIYAADTDILLKNLPVKSDDRFANLEIRVPHSKSVYFDTEQDERGVIWASPVQSYLEMVHSTDARLHEGAEAIRAALLNRVAQAEENA